MSVNLDYMKVWVTQSKCWCECKELDDWNSYKDFYMRDASTCDCEFNKAYLEIKIRHINAH